MIELEITEELITNHYNLFFGKNKKYTKRLYRKLESCIKLEKQTIVKRILKWIFNDLELLIMGDLTILDLAVKEYEKHIKELSQIDRKYLLEKLQIFLDEYEYFKDAVDWNAYKFQRELGVLVCPYCHTQFVFVYEGENGGRTRATLDHFFDKATYPFLAVSLYNLVPSCKVCNSDLKNRQTVSLDTHYSPYEKGIVDKLRLKREVVKVENHVPKAFDEQSDENTDFVGAILGANDEFDILFDYSEASDEIGNKIKGNIKLLHLDKIYNEFHKSYVQDIVKKAIIYNEAYLSQLKSSNTLIFSNEQYLFDTLINKIENDKKNILGKLTREIIEDELNRVRKKNI